MCFPFYLLTKFKINIIMEEHLKALICAFVTVELNTDPYRYLTEKKCKKDILELESNISARIFDECVEYFSAHGSSILLVGSFGSINIHNILLLPPKRALEYAAQSAYYQTPSYKLIDFL